MFGALKKFFRRSQPALPQEPSVSSLPASAQSPPAPAPVPRPSDQAARAPAFPKEKQQPRPAGSNTAMLAAKGDLITVTFAGIVPEVPKDLVCNTDLKGLDRQTFSLSRKKVVEQLAQGAVRVPFGELRRRAPAGLFVNADSHDAKLISLPLKEILPQLSADSFSRRQKQRVVDVPADITNLFSPTGEKLASLRIAEKEERPASTPAPSARKTPEPATVAAAPARPNRGSFGVPPSAAAGSAVVAAKSAPQTPASSPKAPEADRLRMPLAELMEGWPEPVRLEVANLPVSNLVCALPVAEVREGLRAGKVQFQWKQLRSWVESIPNAPTAHGEMILELPLKALTPRFMAAQAKQANPVKTPSVDEIPDVFSRGQSPPANKIPFTGAAIALKTKPAPVKKAPSLAPLPPMTASGGKTLVVIPLSVVKGAWPESLQQEIDTLQLGDANLEIPLDSIEIGLKLGKVSYPWKQLWDWIKPAPTGTPTHCHADLRLEMALNVVAPLYLAQRPKAGSKKPATVINIPDLFNAGGPAAAPASAPADTSEGAAVPEAAPVPVAVPAARKTPQSLAELFNVPDKRSWTPNEIVQHTTQLPGVCGSLIALQDGLLVASCMPPNWKTETIAAFLPQIFGRLRQYSKELDMGDLTSGSFGVEQGVFQVFNAGIIYFAAVGRPGHALPLPELQLIANELSRHTK